MEKNNNEDKNTMWDEYDFKTLLAIHIFYDIMCIIWEIGEYHETYEYST